jgi:transcriptional regulator with XRE-family HTH domain
MAFTAGQLRAARALIGWSQKDLAGASGVTTRTLARIEGEEVTPQAGTVRAICAALAGAGIEFTPENGAGPGVRLKKASAPAGKATRKR